MISNDFLVNFKTGNVSTRALFSKTDALLYTINYSLEKNMPRDVYQQVRSTYYNYQITSVVKMMINKHKVCIENVKDSTNYINLRVEDGEIEVMQKHRELN